MNEDYLDLCGDWQFVPDPFDRGQTAGFFEPGYDTACWHEGAVPASFERMLPSLAGYEGVAWYRKDVVISPEWLRQHAVIRFENVYARSVVWLNGVEIGRNEDGFLPFEFALDGILKPGDSNVLVVRADSTRRAEDVPGRQRGWKPQGGVLREVSLHSGHHQHIHDVRITAEPREAGGFCELQVRLANTGGESADVALAWAIRDGEDQVLARGETEKLALGAGGVATVGVETTVGGARPWTPDQPRLYTATLELRRDGEVIDSRHSRFGFRTIRTEGSRILLNGEPLFVTGFNRHEDSPRTDFGPDHETTRRDLEDMKAMGCNFVRLCHYPHHPRTLEMCDELGLLVMAEIPLYWWQGHGEGEDAFEGKKRAAKRQLERLVERDYNHPSVVMWAVSNETSEEHAEVAAGNGEQVEYCKALDPTRLVTHVSNRWFSHPHFAEDDFIAVNGYPTYVALENHDAPVHGGVWWRDQLEALHARYPTKPVLICEFGYPALEGLTGGDAGEAAQAAALRQEYAAFGADFICGTVVWCYADHPWPEGYFVNGLSTSPYGVVSRDRRRKRAHAVLRELFAAARLARNREGVSAVG